MKKALIALSGLVALVAIGLVVAVVTGKGPVVGDCTAAAGAPPASYRAKAADGNCLAGHVWAPQSPRAVLVAVHGLHDHARRYEGLARAMNEAGIAVLAQDHRGHGGSGGARQRLDSIDQVLGDIEVALGEARRRFPGLPVVLFGHSMGGLSVAHFAARPGAGLAGAIVSSAALKLPPGVSEGQVRVVSAISAVAPALGLEAVDESLIVRDPAARTALAADRLVDREKLPARTVGTLLGGIVALQPRIGSISPPLLVLHGSADKVTDPAGSRALVERAASTDKRLRVFEGALHDLLHEPEGAAVTKEITDFVARLAAAAPAK